MSLNEVVNSFNDGREEAWATAICALLRACKADLGGEAAAAIASAIQRTSKELACAVATQLLPEAKKTEWRKFTKLLQEIKAEVVALGYDKWPQVSEEMIRHIQHKLADAGATDCTVKPSPIRGDGFFVTFTLPIDTKKVVNIPFKQSK